MLHSLSPNNDAKLQEVQKSYGSSPTVPTAAIDMQDEVMKHMKRIETIQGDTFTDDDIDPRIMGPELHNLRQRQLECAWIELADALRGPAHVARMLNRRCQERNSTPARPYKINEEQLQCIALFVSRFKLYAS